MARRLFGIEQLVAQMRAGEYQMQRAADRARHRDMARNHQVERQAGDLEFDQRRIDCVARADQRAD